MTTLFWGAGSTLHAPPREQHHPRILLFGAVPASHCHSFGSPSRSKRTALYQAALDQLNKDQMTYRCICSRKHIEETLRASGAELGRHEDLIYPGSCRNQNRQEEKAAIRVALPGSCVLQFKDRMKTPVQLKSISQKSTPYPPI